MVAMSPLRRRPLYSAQSLKLHASQEYYRNDAAISLHPIRWFRIPIYAFTENVRLNNLIKMVSAKHLHYKLTFFLIINNFL